MTPINLVDTGISILCVPARTSVDGTLPRANSVPGQLKNKSGPGKTDEKRIVSTCKLKFLLIAH